MATPIPIEGKPTKDDLTIGGPNFSVPLPYEEGHVLRANEAEVLNQTYCENLRNNFSKTVAEAVAAAEESGGSLDIPGLQKELTEYVQEYDFGVRRGGFRTTDPVRQVAMEMARDKVRKALKRAGHKLADVGSAKISELAARAIETNPGFMEKAREQVERAQEVGLENAEELLAEL